jgi:hypothetical protein
LQVGCPSKAKEAPLALKALYDADVTEEDIILAWHDKEDAAKVGTASLLLSETSDLCSGTIDWLVASNLECEGIRQCLYGTLLVKYIE